MRAVCVAFSGLLAACAGGPSTFGGTLAEYSPANALFPVGFSETLVGENHYQVQASGNAVSPFERVEKIAIARAAELGIGLKAGYFKVTSSTRDVVCTKKKPGYKVPDTAGAARPKVTLDVIYAVTATDPEFQNAKDTFGRLSEELKAESYPPETLQAAADSLKAKCGV